jgi:hypothetical protein
VISGLNQPDDLLYHQGSLLVGALGAGKIEVLTPGKATVELPIHIAATEGMVYIGANLYVGGQTQDAVFEVNGDQLRTVIQLTPVPGQDGVDGIGAQGNLLVVPDSARGVVDWVDPASGRITKSLGGFVRPTGVWAEPNGSLLVADEYGNAAVRIASDGSRTYLARGLPIVDDIAEDQQGNAFVVMPVNTGGRLVQVAPNAPTDVVDGLAAPQGIAIDDAGNLFFSEENAGRVDVLIRSFKLVPMGQLSDSATQPVCVNVARAPGFQGDIHLAGGAGLEVVEQPGTGDRGAVLLTGCQAAACGLTATSGALSDTLWIQAH